MSKSLLKEPCNFYSPHWPFKCRVLFAPFSPHCVFDSNPLSKNYAQFIIFPSLSVCCAVCSFIFSLKKSFLSLKSSLKTFLVQKLKKIEGSGCGIKGARTFWIKKKNLRVKYGVFVSVNRTASVFCEHQIWMHHVLRAILKMTWFLGIINDFSFNYICSKLQ